MRIARACIRCGLRIDVCDNVMAKIGRPPRLIAHNTEIDASRRLAGKPNLYKPIRDRTILYAVVITRVGDVMAHALASRVDLAVSVIHDRNPMFVKTADGAIRNGYVPRIVNRGSVDRAFAIRVEGAQLPQRQAIGLRGARVPAIWPAFAISSRRPPPARSATL